jgi:hypothetical protein
MQTLDANHKGFLLTQSNSLLHFAYGSVINSGGFGYLNEVGKVDASKPLECYLQARKIQVFGLSHLMELADCKNLVQHGVDSLSNLFRDKAVGGFYNSIDINGKPLSKSKFAYDHMFVLLAATTAREVDVAGAQELFDYSEEIIEKYFWDGHHRMMNNHWDQDFTTLDSYRGINSNMHAVEALTAAFEATGKPVFRDQAYEICMQAVDVFARNNQWMLPEHFDAQWKVLKDFNSENPADPFRPFGITIGHLFEWSRLILQIGLCMPPNSEEHSWILEGARALYEIGKNDGWAADGFPGFVYTLDWNKKPVVKSRMQWVAAEAVMAAFTLWKVTGEGKYLEDYFFWWSYIQEHVIDNEYGSWHHELNANQEVTSFTWSGKPDVYHAFNACILPLLPFGASFIGSAKLLKAN